ncbi:unnamed protein product, partial [Linum tenue]
PSKSKREHSTKANSQFTFGKQRSSSPRSAFPQNTPASSLFISVHSSGVKTQLFGQPPSHLRDYVRAPPAIIVTFFVAVAVGIQDSASSNHRAFAQSPSHLPTMKRKQKKLDAFFPRNVLPCTGNHFEEEVQVVPRALNLGIDERSNVVVNEDSLISPRVTNPSFALIERDPGLLIKKQTSEEVKKNRIRVKASIDSARWLALQGAAFRAHDETLHSKNRGNFIELIDRFSYYNDEVKSTVLGNAPKNAKYTSSDIQKQILHVQLRRQGYDGASNMRGEWNGLKALFLKDHPQDYYVHCMAHRLQLALVAASKDVTAVHEFFIDLAHIVNVVNASSKRHDQLEVVEAAMIAQLVAGEEIATGTSVNQMSTLQGAGDTRWSSHLNSISSVIRLYESSYKVLEDIKKDGYTAKNKGDARVALRKMSSYEFIFILLLLNDIFGTTDTLCRALQHKSQDIVNAMSLVEITKMVLKEMRDEGWDSFLTKVNKFCKDYSITVPDFSASHFEGRPCRQVDTITNEHHYHFDIFNAALDVQIEELRARFEEKIVELLKLSSSLDPSNGYKAFDVNAICSLAGKSFGFF